MYREKARKDYLALAKCRKRGTQKIRKAIRKQRRCFCASFCFCSTSDSHMVGWNAFDIMALMRKDELCYNIRAGAHSNLDAIYSFTVECGFKQPEIYTKGGRI